MTSRAIALRTEDERGFSLIELMIVALISTMIISSAVVLSNQVSKTYSHQLNDGAVQQEGRFAMEWILRTLATAGSNPYGITAAPCAGVQFTPLILDPNGNGIQDDIRVHADVNPPDALLIGDAGNCFGVNADPGEDVTIGIATTNAAPAGNALLRFDRAIDAAPVEFTDQVFRQLQFTYLTNARVVTANPARIAYVQVNLVGRSRAQMDGAGRHTSRAQFTTWAYQSEVRVRAR